MKAKTTTEIRIVSFEDKTLVLFLDEAARADIAEGKDNENIKTFAVEGLSIGKDFSIILENGEPTLVEVID